jgi:hypothetical protein
MADQSNVYRLRAVACEQRSKQTADPTVKKEWDELAIEWHLLANIVAQATNKIPKIDVA